MGSSKLRKIEALASEAIAALLGGRYIQAYLSLVEINKTLSEQEIVV